MTPQITDGSTIVDLIDDEIEIKRPRRSGRSVQSATCSSSVETIRRSKRKRRATAKLSDFIVEEEESLNMQHEIELVQPVDNFSSSRDAEIIDVEKLLTYTSQGNKIERGQFVVKLLIGPDEFVLADAVEYLESLGYVEIAKDDDNDSDDSLSYLIKEEIYDESNSSSTKDSLHDESEIDVESMDYKSFMAYKNSEPMILPRRKKPYITPSKHLRDPSLALHHNVTERMRRNELKQLFKYLHDCISKCRPTEGNEKLVKQKILSDAIVVSNKLKKDFENMDWALMKLTQHNQKLIEKKLNLLAMEEKIK